MSTSQPTLWGKSFPPTHSAFADDEECVSARALADDVVAIGVEGLEQGWQPFEYASIFKF